MPPCHWGKHGGRGRTRWVISGLRLSEAKEDLVDLDWLHIEYLKVKDTLVFLFHLAIEFVDPE